MAIVFADTNIIIEYLKGNESVIQTLYKFDTVYINDVVIMELYQGARDKRELNFIKKNILRFEILKMNQDIIVLAKEILECYTLSHNTKIMDALIASTVIMYNMVENYLNLKLYPNLYLPKIADIFPMIALDAEGRCSLFMQQEIILYKDISQNFALAKEFRASNKFQNRVLPEQYIGLLKSLENHLSFGEYGTPTELLDKYFMADEQFLKSFFAEMFENELLAILGNAPIMLSLLQGGDIIPSHILNIFRDIGILPNKRDI